MSDPNLSRRFPPHVLREYALLADGERGAVVGPRGEIGWLCAPQWHDASVFTALIGGRGAFQLAPERPFVWGGSYDEGSMIWRSRWVTTDGIVECREALAFPADPHRVVLLRRVKALDRPATVLGAVEPRGDYDRRAMSQLHRHGGVWTARVGALYLRLTGAGGAHVRDHRTTLEFALDLDPGARHDLVLELSLQPLPADPPDADDTWRATEAAWAAAVPALDDTLNPPDTRRSYAVLRGLTSSTGGMVAAATTSLPERVEAGRNYDYRYAWIRDQCYAGRSAAVAGGYDLLDPAVRFVSERILDAGDKLAPAYTVTAAPVPDQRSLSLPGYPGGADIVGNWVNDQFQLDAYGEALGLFAAAAAVGRLDTTPRDAINIAITAITERWQEPDAGIWEIEPRAWTHSRLTAAAGLRAVATIPEQRDRAGDLSALADRIVADTAAHALHGSGRWQRAADDEGLDAALLLPPLRGALPMDDPRSLATFDAYLAALTRNGYAYRFRHDERPLADAEGAFLLCGFLVALSHDRLGNAVQARSWYDVTRAATGPAQLFSEEYDIEQHQMRGNLPQAFVHALHLETAATLADPTIERIDHQEGTR